MSYWHTYYAATFPLSFQQNPRFRKRMPLLLQCPCPHMCGVWAPHLRDTLFGEDTDNHAFNQHPKKDIWFIKAKALYSSYEKYGIDNHLFEKGKFRGTYLKKALLEFESVSWDKSCRQNGHISKYVVLNREILREELKKYKFTVDKKDDEVLDMDE